MIATNDVIAASAQVFSIIEAVAEGKDVFQGRYIDKAGRWHDRDNGGFCAAPDLFRAMNNGNAERDVRTELPSTIVEIQRSIITTISDILRISDVSVRKDRRLQRMMLHDPDIVGPLNRRRRSVVLLPWHVQPEDESNAKQVEQAAHVERMIRRCRKWHDLILQLMWAAWYGSSGAILRYRQQGPDVWPERWLPVHPDSFVFDVEGNAGVKVNQWRYLGETHMGPEAHVRMLYDPTDRAQVIIHTIGQQGADFEVPEEAEYAYKGRGLRDVMFYVWSIKQRVLQLWTAYAERYAMGTRKGTYPAGNAAGKTAMTKLMRNVVGDMQILLPRILGEKGTNASDLYSFDIMFPNPEGQKVYAELINNYLSGKLRDMILGDPASSERISEGLGTGVTDRRADTENDVVVYDCLSLEDTLTADLVAPVHAMNYGETDWRPKFEFAKPETDVEDWMTGATKAYEMGVAIDEDQVRGKLGLTKPEDGAPTLQKPDPMVGDAGGLFGPFEGMNSLIGGGADLTRMASDAAQILIEP